jgi:cellobiose-specific phosphotransferase system component IIC
MIDASPLQDLTMTQPWKFRMLRRAGAFVVAAAAMVLLGSAAHSYFVQQAWSGAAGNAFGTAPAAIPFADRISWAAHDLVGMFLPYCSLTSIALLVAFLIAGALARFTGHRAIIFALAGALALFVLFTVMRSVLGTVGVFGARGAAGLAAQMAVGAVAGVLFARLTRRPDRLSASAT